MISEREIETLAAKIADTDFDVALRPQVRGHLGRADTKAVDQQ
jgi:hypothetical protein